MTVTENKINIQNCISINQQPTENWNKWKNINILNTIKKIFGKKFNKMHTKKDFLDMKL